MPPYKVIEVTEFELEEQTGLLYLGDGEWDPHGYPKYEELPRTTTGMRVWLITMSNGKRYRVETAN